MSGRHVGASEIPPHVSTPRRSHESRRGGLSIGARNGNDGPSVRQMGEQGVIKGKAHSPTRHRSRAAPKQPRQGIDPSHGETCTDRAGGSSLRHWQKATESLKHKRTNLGGKVGPFAKHAFSARGECTQLPFHSRLRGAIQQMNGWHSSHLYT